MAGTPATDFIFFTGATGGSTSTCDATTDWSGSPTLDTETYVQGTGALSAKVSKTRYTSVFTFSSSVDLTDKVLIVWMAMGSPNIMATKAAGGVAIRVEDGSANWAEWYVAGKDTWAGGYRAFAVHTSTTPDNKSTTAPTMSAITKAGVACETTASSSKVNFWWDALRYGTYMQLYAGTSGSPGTFADLVTYENTNKIGAFIEEGGVLYAQCRLLFGSTSAGVATYFKDATAKLIMFRDSPVPSTFYEILLQGNGTATTEVYFGNKLGGTGLGGIAVRCENTAKPYKITASDTNVTKFGFWGCSFYNPSTITGQAYDADKEFLNCLHFSGAEMLPDTGVVQNGLFVSAPGNALRITSESHNVSDCVFANCVYATNVTAAGSYVLEGCRYYSNTSADINNTSGGTVNISARDTTAPPTTYTGTTYIRNDVWLRVYVYDQGGLPIENAQTAIYLSSDDTQLMNEDSDVDGLAEELYDYDGEENVYLRVRKSDVGDTRYKQHGSTGKILASGLNVVVTLELEPLA